MIWIDFVILGIVIIGVIVGIWRGFSAESFAIFTWLIALSVSLNFDKDFVRFMPMISGDNPAVKSAGAFIALLMITLVVAAMIGFLLGTFGSGHRVGFFSRLGGMIMSFVRSVILITVLVMLAGTTALPKDSWWQESKLLSPFQLLAVGLRDHVPSGIAEYVKYH